MDRITEMAGRLIEARRAGKPFGVGAQDLRPLDLGEVYAVQAKVADSVGKPGAFKVGSAEPGDDVPVFAPIFARNVVASPAQYPSAQPRLFGIELEIAFRIIAPLPDPTSADFPSAARAAVEALPVLEIVDSRLSDYDAAGVLWKLADNQINEGVVAGPPLKDWSNSTAAPDVRLTAGGKSIAEGRREVPGGDAWQNFCALAKHLGTHCGGLQVGQIVITGSLTGLVFLEGAGDVHATIAGLGEVRAVRG